MRRLLYSLSIATLAVALPAQPTTWVVDATGSPGSQFTDIQPAIDAAMSGDRILVRPGVYGGFTVDGKGLAILGGPGVGVFGSTPNLRVRNTTAGQSVVLAGFTGLAGSLFFGAQIDGCAGRVLLEKLNGSSWQIRNSADVRVNDCHVGVTTEVDGSRATFSDSTLSATPPTSGSLPALDVSSSDIVLARCDVAGADAFLRSPASPAIRLDSGSEITLTDDGSHAIVAGLPSSGGLPAIFGGGTVIRDPRVRVLGARGATPFFGPTVRAEHVPTLQALGAPVGSTIEVDLAGLPGEMFVLVFGLPGTPVRLPGIRGELGLGLPLATEQGIFHSGTIHRSFVAAPGLPAGIELCWQALTSDGLGGFALSNHATYTRVR